MGRIVVGTAGHIDHGKSSLVRALTGTDPDRLPEEKRRQITIDLGYAFLDDVAAIIDVPGHEKFIHNMVAGAATVDFALLVIASDDGIMPQTREHLNILRLLGLQKGAIVLTKIGMTEPAWRDLVKDQIVTTVQSTFLQGAPIFEADSLSGQGIPELKSYLLAELPKLSPRSTSDVLRIPIDRVFSVHGHGTVVTGTVLSGTVEKEQRVEIMPAEIEARVKQLQSNARDQTVIRSGMRAALNLHSNQTPVRGQTITLPKALAASRRLAVEFEQIPDAPQVKDRQRIRFLIGTQEAMGRFRIIGADDRVQYAFVLLDEPVVAAWNDRFILRRYSPLDTLGGGRVLDLDPPLRASRHRAQVTESLKAIASPDVKTAISCWLEARAPYSAPILQVCRQFAFSEAYLRSNILKNCTRCKVQAGHVFHVSSGSRWQELLATQLESLHREQPNEPGFTAQMISKCVPLLPAALLDWSLAELVSARKIIADRSLFKLAGAKQGLDTELEKLIASVMDRLIRDGFAPPSSSALSEELGRSKGEVERALVTASRTDRAVRLGTDIFFERSVFFSAIEKVRALLESRGSLQVSDLSKELGSSRKFVVPFLEYLDTQGLTERRGNDRFPGRNFEKS